MKILKKDLKHGKIVVGVQNLDDLWHLSQVIDKGDFVSGKTTRKIRKGEKEEAAKQTLFLVIEAKEVEFKDKSLRVSGKTVEEKEEVPKGSYHTITLEEGSSVGIVKEKLSKSLACSKPKLIFENCIESFIVNWVLVPSLSIASLKKSSIRFKEMCAEISSVME